MKKVLPLHPFLIALWIVLFVYAENVRFISFVQMGAPLIFMFSLTAMLFLLFLAVMRTIWKAAAWLSLFLLLFFSFAHVHTLLWKSVTLYMATGESLALMVAWLVLFVVGGAVMIKINDSWPNITKSLNAAALTLVLLSVMNVGAYELKTVVMSHGHAVEEFKIEATDGRPAEALPNIYYIILDAYARDDILEEIYSYDNLKFLNYLMEQGFVIERHSQSNYSQTDLSLASSLNLHYLDDMAARLGTESNDRRPLESLIQDSAVFQFLRHYGYTIVAVPSGHSPTDLKRADVYLGYSRPLNELEVRLLCSTPLPWLAIRGSFTDPYATHRGKILYSFGHLADAAELPGPHFVFAHILAPHAPFVFDEEGNEINPEQQYDMRASPPVRGAKELRQNYVTGYTGQLAFVNQQIMTALDQVLARESRPTVIVLQSDHGPDCLVDWYDPSNTYFKEKHAILNAYLLPGDGAADLYDRITPVNTFRVIFDHYLGTELGLLEDRSYFSTWDHPYQFIDVTDNMHSGGNTAPQ